MGLLPADLERIAPMRKASFTLAAISVLGLAVAGSAVFAAGDHLSAAPPVPSADKEKNVRAPKVITVTPEQLRAEIKQIQTDLLLKPNDAQLHFKLGEALRKFNQTNQASAEYLKAIECDPTLWVAYHQLTNCTNDAEVLDALIVKLSKLESEKPKELLLRVALSELYEKRGNYYQAARTLIDLSYANAVPEKFRPKVSARIHNMLLLSKSHHPAAKADEAAQATPVAGASEEDLDLMPAPLPMPGTKRSIAQAKLKDSKEVRGMGHTPLLP